MKKQTNDYEWKPRNFTFDELADRRLWDVSRESGKTMTAVLEDLLLGRRQFKPDIEKFLEDESTRTGRPRHDIIEAAVLCAARFSNGKIPNRFDEMMLNETSSGAPTVEGTIHKVVQNVRRLYSKKPDGPRSK